jgi:hypothetical protein
MIRYVRVGEGLPGGMFYLLWSRMYADKDTDVEINGEGEEGLDVPSVAGRGCREGAEDESECL